MQDKPQLFSTALMWLLAELFEELPEAGDLRQPKLVFFFDEAHLLFDDATEAFLDSVAHTVRLIRSKGVGVFFVTQTPKDVPADVLGQLGNRVQHALRAFTPDDAKALKATVVDLPEVRLLRPRGAADLARDRRGRGDDPVRERRARRPVVHTKLRAPRRGWRRPTTSTARRRRRRCWRSTATRIDAQSAREILAARLEAARRRRAAAHGRRPSARSRAQGGRRRGGGGAEAIGDFLKPRRASRSSARSCAASSGC